ncbi:transposase [Nonomuraea guangzhouensis]|uniref:Transposase n=1 Tax=Nonomuraea guangzhouensis TaxID=1291555 RepID=A0ABW4GX24_9ACTN|nr:transposase [Nonomuraea guangzhouensis]
MATWRGPDGIEVEVVVLDKRPCLRVTQVVNDRRFYEADCFNLHQLAEYVDLADLCEVIAFPDGSASRRLRR